MVPLKLLLRTAVRLQRVWQAKASPQNGHLALERLAALQRQLRRAQQRCDKARAHRLALIAPHLQTQVLGLVTEIEKAARTARASLEQPAFEVPSLSFLVAELRQVEGEFGEIQIDSKERFLCATTEPIMLQGLYLGSFAIHFFWDRLHHHPDVQCFDILALDPHPAATDSRVTHPHVKSKQLCAGDAKSALSKALEQGRLADAFCLIHSVLANYNVNSPHVRVDEWGGTTCHACDCGSMDEDDCQRCEPCGHDYCPDCWSNCGICGDVRCLDCMKCCAVCYERCCGRCLHGSVHSGRECCRTCLRTCAACGAPVAKDEVSPATDRCPRCRVPESSCARGDQPPSSGQGPLPAPEIPSLEHEPAKTLELVAPTTP